MGAPVEINRKPPGTLPRRALETIALQLIEHTSSGVMITDADGTIQKVNAAFSVVTGYSEAEVLGKNPSLLQSGRQPAAFYREMWAALKTTGSWQGQIWNRRKSGVIYPEWLSICAIRDDDNVITHHVGVFSDISEIKTSEDRLLNLAYHDPLTGLPNRRLFRDRMELALARCARHETTVYLLFFDLDAFKPINDTFGHAVGDQVLEEVARRLRSAVRATDSVSRFGGDEFTVMIEGIGLDELRRVADKLIALVSEPITVQDRTVQVTSSVGVASCPQDGTDADLLLKKADAAMYRAKSLGKNRLWVSGQQGFLR